MATDTPAADAPRIAPLTPAEWTEEPRTLLKPVHDQGIVYNVRGVFSRHWKAYQKFRVWASHVMGDTQTLTPREREMLILRTGLAWGADYEYRQHVLVARRVGLTDEEIARIHSGPDAPGWQPHDAALLRAADDLRTSAEISDPAWAELSRRYSTEQLMDVIFTVGHYTTVAMVLKSCRVPPDAGLPAD